MPIDIDDNFCCNVSKQSPLALLIKDAKLIVWDEASMAKKYMIEALDVLLRDIMDVKTLFGGKVVVFGGDFRQTLPKKFPERARTYVAVDETVEPNDQTQFEDFLHTLHPPGLPPYKLTLKENCPVMLLRNLNPSEGLCNGTRLTCCNLKTHVISVKIESGDFKNTHVFIPRIPLLTSQDEKIPVQFKRTQFPVRLCFAMTINKAQGQTLDFVGIYLREPVFSHGQLYVALSRAKSSKCVKILIRPPTADSNDDHSTYNIVYDEIIQRAFS
ncbi:hypothetical protein H5410_039600 [Solanum commersonii]|uniref:ATP-dependent DNA helicase n=1 Tax=Solanum commersonii TaxID=4109 RepID=A0A9J5XQ19_SOLCO|nr:hypothetical protein H5410_039600 [Solanum commersonii]